MNTITLKWLENILNTKAVRNNILDININHISTDTRNLVEGSLFVALRGENFDGHNFLEDAKIKGACGAIVHKNEVEKQKIENFFLLEVDDTLSAFQKIAKAYRDELPLNMINITGSNGKTTTKDMACSILSTTYKTYCTEGNLNNEIGVPISLLSLDNTYKCAVLELGMTHKGDINTLLKITNPKIRVWTNVAPAHLQNFSSIEDIADAKSEILDFYNNGDIAILNSDDDLVKKRSENFKGKKIFFGIKNSADVKAIDIKNNEFTLVIENKIKKQVTLPIIGKHNIYNALASASVGYALNVDPEKIVFGLNNFKASSGRMEIHKFNGLWIINDAYNANPVSMKSAINTFEELESDRQKILVLGDMCELGKKEIDFHVEIGKLINFLKINFLFTYGNLAKYIAESAIENGMKKDKVFICNTHEEINSKLKNIFSGKDIVLLKGSRAMKMETVLEQVYRLKAEGV